MALAWFDPQTVEHLKLIFSALLLLGLILTALQIHAARRQARANVLLRLIDEWNASDLYDSIRYIHQLRTEWKAVNPDASMWQPLAGEWVKENAPRNGEPVTGDWIKRRRAAQFLSKMGYMLRAGYLTRDDLFTTVPEARRLLVVIIPIEREIAKRYSTLEKPLAQWDRPFEKLHFDSVQTEFDLWFQDQELARLGK